MNTKGTVSMSLHDYNYLRDSLEVLLKTTDTQEEFLRKIRTIMAIFVGKAKEAGLDMSEMYSYFKDLDFKEILDVDIEKLQTEGQEPGTPSWLLSIKLKEDE